VLGNWRDIDAVTGLKEADRMVKSQPNHPGPWLAKGIFLARPAPTIVESLPDGGVRKTYNRPVRYEEAQRAFSEGIQHALRATNERHVLLNLLRLHRAEVFRELGQLPEAAQDIAAALGICRRDPQTPNRLVDLSAFYSAPLVECWTNWGFAEIRSPSLDLVPGSRQMFAGVEFDVRGVLMPGGIAPANSLACTYARSIPVNLACRRLHFLHATLRASNVGAQVGTYWVHCQDGRTESIPIEYGVDVLGWKDESAQSQPPFRASVAWMSKDHNGAVLRLYKSTWTNPRPDVPVVSLDFSREQGDASLFLVSVTAESVESERLAGNLR